MPLHYITGSCDSLNKSIGNAVTSRGRARDAQRASYRFSRGNQISNIQQTRSTALTMSGDIFSTYSFGTSSPSGNSMGFSFAPNSSLDAQLYGGASALDSGLETTNDHDYRLFMEQQPMIGLATDKEKGKFLVRGGISSSEHTLTERNYRPQAYRPAAGDSDRSLAQERPAGRLSFQ